MSRFTDRLARDLDQIAGHASPSTTTAWEAIQTRIAEQDDQSEMEIVMLSPDPEEPGKTTRRRWLVAASAAVAALAVVGGVLIANRSNDDVVATDPEPTVPTTESAPEPDPVQVASEAVATAEQFVSAFVNLDPGLVAEMLVEDPTLVSVETANDRESLGRWIAHHEAMDTEFELQGCAFTEPNQVRCEVQWRNAWFDAGDFPPVDSTFFLVVDGEEITAVRYAFDFENLEAPYTQFRRWLRDNHPDDAESLWVEESGIIRGPSLTDEAPQIFQARTADYLASLSGE